MEGKTVVITGANAGIGFETAKALAQKRAQIFIICRNKAKGQKAQAALIEESQNTAIELITADMSSQQQIRAAASQIRSQIQQLDVLINNAGTWISQYTETEDGVETVFAVNHLAYFLLTHEFYPLLAKSPDARIINLSSDSHFQFQGKLNFDDLFLKNNYHGLRSYAATKLANVFFTYEFARRNPNPNIVMNAVQPGLVHTDIGLKHTTWLHSFAWKVRRTLWKSKTPAEGAATSIYLASDPTANQHNGKYLEDCQPKASSKDSYNEEYAQKYWEVSEELCGIEEYF